jgi:CHASE2 domain-containing sensor protein
MPSRASKDKPKRPRDPNLLARSVVQDLIGEKWDGTPLERPPEREKNQAAVALSKLGASKGGVARAASLTAKQRSKIARRAAKARWRKVA